MTQTAKQSAFFLKISKETGKAWRNSLPRTKRLSLTRPFQTFCLTARAYLNTQNCILQMTFETTISELMQLQFNRGTQRQFLENICSEDYLRSRILITFVAKFCLLACLSQDLRTSKKWYNCPFLTYFYPKKNFRELFFWLKFPKGKF